MRYDISKQTAPKMPRLGKGTECVKISAIAGIKNPCYRRYQKTCMPH